MDSIPPISVKHWSRSWWFAQIGIGILVGAFALWWAMRGLEWSGVIASLVAAQYFWVGMSLLCVLAVALTKIWRWGALYFSSEIPVTFRDLFSALMITQMINVLIPVRVGEIVRIGLMKQTGQPGAATLSTIAIEKAVDLVATGLIAVAVVALAFTPTWLQNWAGSVLFLGIVFVFGLIAVWLLRNQIEAIIRRLLGWGTWLPTRWQTRLIGITHTVLQAFGSLTSGASVARIVFWTALTWCASIGSILTLFKAFDMALPWTVAIVLMLSMSFGNLAPTPPALVGITQAIAVVVLGSYGIAQPTALGFGIVLNVVAVGPLILLGCVGLGQRAVSILSVLQHWGNKPK